MRNEFGCPGNAGGRLCNYDLTRWVKAAPPETEGETVVRVACPWCNGVVLITANWRNALVPSEVMAVPEGGVE